MCSHTKARSHEGKNLIIYLLRDFVPSCETSFLTNTNAVNGFVNLLMRLNETKLPQSTQIWSVSSRPLSPPKMGCGQSPRCVLRGGIMNWHGVLCRRMIVGAGAKTGSPTHEGGGVSSNQRHHAQKYPSRFFSSIEPASSWSMTRPCRSEFVATSISSMISGSVVALLSIAPVSG